MSRIELAKTRALTFYNGEVTAARRTSALPQLSCIGKACKLYQPEVVRCANLGGSGTDIDWKCEADLPESLRFGKVEVNCEGWARPGDPYVLKGSCALEYRLVQVPDALRNGGTDSPFLNRIRSYDLSTILFWIFWFSILAFIVYRFFLSWWPRTTPGGSRGSTASGSRPRPWSGGGGGGGGGGWFPGTHPDYNNSPPPPYSKDAPQSGSGWESWRPGFWSGAAVGGLAQHLWNRRQNAAAEQPPMRTWGWERARNPFFAADSQPVRRTSYFDASDRGEGTSNLGAMRRSTGLGGTNVR